MIAKTAQKINKVIVVGTGPAGLALSLMLARHGIAVECLDMLPKLEEQPRATHYNPPAVRVLRKAGLLEYIQKEGIEVGGMKWRKPDGTILAGVDNSKLGDHPDRLVCLPLNKLCKFALEEALKEPLVTVKWSHRVDRIRQDDNAAYVEVETPEGRKEFSADYVVGCDGARSIIRRELFGDDFPGHTWDKQIIATNVYYDFQKYGWDHCNFIIHPENYFMAAKIQKDGLWRVSYGEVPGLTTEEYRKRQPKKFEDMLPGNPKPDQYKIVNFSPYKVHQRLAPSLRVGRFLLAADAAHICNPFGGMGLTGGLVDVGELFDCLAGISDGLASPSILDIYSGKRREKYNTFVNPISTNMLTKMSSDPDDIEANDPEMVFLREADKTVEKSKELQLGVLGLAYDIKQHYDEV